MYKFVLTFVLSAIQHVSKKFISCFKRIFFFFFDGDCEPVIFCLFGWKRQRPPEVFCEKSDSKKKETPTQVFSREFCEIFKNAFFAERLWATASEKTASIFSCLIQRCIRDPVKYLWRSIICKKIVNGYKPLSKKLVQ